MNILEELYYGNLVPFERNLTEAERELLQYSIRHQRALTETLSEEQEALFEKYRTCLLELGQTAEQEAFLSGFRLGGQIVMAAAQKES